jgi:hypothetical protein
MKKEELLEELDAMIDDEINIINLQENQNGETLKMLWNIKKMVEELE